MLLILTVNKLCAMIPTKDEEEEKVTKIFGPFDEK